MAPQLMYAKIAWRTQVHMPFKEQSQSKSKGGRCGINILLERLQSEHDLCTSTEMTYINELMIIPARAQPESERHCNTVPKQRLGVLT